MITYIGRPEFEIGQKEEQPGPQGIGAAAAGYDVEPHQTA